MKGKAVVFFILALLLAFSVASAENGQNYFKFDIKSHDELNKLTKVISIDNVKGSTVFAYANDREFANFRQLGYSYQILPDPGSLINPPMSDRPSLLLDWDTYPTYNAYLAMMDSFALEHPDLCQIVNIGSTVQGRALLFAKISANVSQEENEPEVQFSSSMHGDEATGYVLMLRLIDYLLTNYGIDPVVTNLLDSEEIWINPLANPDGTYHGGNNSVNGAVRYNANNVDLNRNFPDPADGPHPDGNAWQPENVAMMNFFDQHSFTISANFHGGAEVVNYPWDTWQRRHPDDTWCYSISRAYADTVHEYCIPGYMDDLDDGVTNGYDWYRVAGGRQDYMTYFKNGREVTIEISSTKLLPANQLPAHWTYNKNSFLQYLENALYGIRGVVTDANTGLPLFAKIEVVGHDVDSSFVRTDPQVGDYHRMIAPGTYEIRISAAGYLTAAIPNVVVVSRSSTILDAQLTPVPNNPILSFQNHDAGIVDPADSVAMHITLVNNGGADAINTDAILSTSDSYVTILQDSSSYPTITRIGGTGTSLSLYRFAVSPSCPLQHLAHFSLHMTADGYSDSTSFDILIGQQIEDFEAGNFNSYPWQFSGNQYWIISVTGPYEGRYSAKSGTITHYQSSEMYTQLEVSSPGTISFYYKVSSEQGYDFLKFFIDDVPQAQWSGTVAWTQASFNVSAGAHTFKWGYYKDQSVSYGSDAGWVDFIVFPSLSVPVSILTDSLPDWTINRPYSQQLQAEGGTGNLNWSDASGGLVGTGLSLAGNGLVSGTPVAVRDITFMAQVEDQLGGSAQRLFTFTINAHLLITTDVLPDGTVDTPYSVQLVALGGTGLRTWSDRDNDLSGTGLTLSTGGLLSGAPTAAGMINFTAIVHDIASDSAQRDYSFEIFVSGGLYMPGDVNGNGSVNGLDVVFLVNYFKGGDLPPFVIDCPPHGQLYAACDVNGNCAINGIDVIYFVNYLKGGSGPMSCPDCPPGIGPVLDSFDNDTGEAKY